jgi:outer membrane murein-binding lipoprotein Lpp
MQIKDDDNAEPDRAQEIRAKIAHLAMDLRRMPVEVQIIGTEDNRRTAREKLREMMALAAELAGPQKR